MRRYSPTKLCNGAQMAIFASCICQRQSCTAINCLSSGINIWALGSSVPLISERKGTDSHCKQVRCLFLVGRWHDRLPAVVLQRSVVEMKISTHRNKLRFALYIKLTCIRFKICILICCLCYCAILVGTANSLPLYMACARRSTTVVPSGVFIHPAVWPQ